MDEGLLGGVGGCGVGTEGTREKEKSKAKQPRDRRKQRKASASVLWLLATACVMSAGLLRFGFWWGAFYVRRLRLIRVRICTFVAAPRAPCCANRTAPPILPVRSSPLWAGAHNAWGDKTCIAFISSPRRRLPNGVLLLLLLLLAVVVIIQYKFSP